MNENEKNKNFDEPIEPIELPKKKSDVPTSDEEGALDNSDGKLSEDNINNSESSENKTEIESNGHETANFESASENTDDSTVLFVADDEDSSDEVIKKSIKVVKTTKKAVGFSLKSVWFVLRKAISLLLVTLMTFILVGIITGIVVGAVFFKYVTEYIDGSIDLSGIQFELGQSTGIYYLDDNGNMIEIEEERLHGSENRQWATYDEIPQQLVLAFVAVEDKRFFEHSGVDIKRSINAFINFFIPISENAGGGSTITQQLIKNITKEDEVKIQRKVQEMLRAINLEKQYDKEEILEMYLNTIYLSQNSYGIKTAAYTYFGKELDELTLAECAALAAIPKSPTYYDPIRNPENNLERRRTVLKLMYDQGKITLEQFNEAYNVEELTISPKVEETTDVIHSYYVDAVVEQVIDDLCEHYGYSREIASQILYSGGLKIVTCMDPFVQETMESVFAREDYYFLEGMTGIMPEAAMVVMNPENGAVLGIVGGLGEKTANRSLNRATQSRRQCGSAIKPLSVYAPALDRGLITYGTVIDDTPYETYTAANSPTGKTYVWPPNTPAGYNGLVTINYALERSLNTVAVKVLDQLGVEESFEFLTEELGFTSIVDRVVTESGEVLSDIGLAPLGLGGFTYGVTTLEMCAGYTMLANQGIYSAPRLYYQVRDNQDTIILTQEEEKRVVIKESTAYIMTKMLENVVNYGTGSLVTLGKGDTPQVEVAGKTGSTNDNRDRYFVGYTPYYVGAVWFGYDSNKTLGTFPINPALAFWDYVMLELHEHIEETNGGNFKTFERPDNIVESEFCIDSGKLPSEACKYDPRGDRTDIGYYVEGTEPTEECDTHVLVWWDTKNEAVASASTPVSDLTKIALLNIPDRSFQVKVYVEDAEYVYREIPPDYTFPTTNDVPYFQNLIPDGVYVGETYPREGHHPVNSFSFQTYNKDEMPDATWIVVGNSDDPDTSEPDDSEPDDSEPDVSEPDVSEPDVSEPDVSEPDVSEPEVSVPDIIGPDVSEPDTSDESEMVIVIP